MGRVRRQAGKRDAEQKREREVLPKTNERERCNRKTRRIRQEQREIERREGERGSSSALRCSRGREDTRLVLSILVPSAPRRADDDDDEDDDVLDERGARPSPAAKVAAGLQSCLQTPE